MLNLYQSDLHSCSYLDHRQASTVFADPNILMDNKLYEHLLQLGFRRSGNYVYTPKCPGCNACISIRIDVQQFRSRRNHRRVCNKNSDISLKRVTAEFNQEHFQLYQNYISARHAGGGMDDPSRKEYLNFLTSQWSNTWFYEYRLNNSLMAVSVVDELSDSLSAVYTFFDKNQAHRSPGHYAILQLIETAKTLDKKWVYLGYYIGNCKKMKYKSQYRPLQAFVAGRWRHYDYGDDIAY